MPNPVLQILGSYGLERIDRFDLITRNYGDGTIDSVLVGHTDGVTEFVLNFEFLPDAELTVTDPEDSDTVKTWVNYFRDFFRRRMGDGSAFDITDPLTGTTYTVKFADSVLTLNYVTYKLYSSQGIRLVQYRAPS